MVVDVAVFCGIIALWMPIDDRAGEKWLDPRTTLTDCGFFTILPYFQYWVVEWKLPWHEFLPLLLCIILMLVPEGPVKRILSNVP